MNKIKIISVDFQKDFTSEKWICYEPRKSVKFIKETLIPFLRDKGIKISEIISDYRLPRFWGSLNLCVPGNFGFESEIPEDIKSEKIWIKSENSPIWTRKNVGKANKTPGLTYQDPKAFKQWIESEIWPPKNVEEVILIGLTIDRCVLCAAQELKRHGYKVKVLEEAVDAYSGSQKEKKQIINSPPLTNWAKGISWKMFKERL
jgi:nicotinamidase-related amidase